MCGVTHASNRLISNGGSGTKRVATVSIIRTNAVLMQDGTSNQQICHGDSGGPAFLTVGVYVASLWLLGALLGSIRADGNLSLIAYVIAIVAAVVGWRTLRDEHPSVARGLGCAVLLTFVLPVVVVVAILGYCIATNTYPMFGP